MVPEHILKSDLYKQLCEDYDDMTFLDNMVIINYEKIEHDEQFEEYVDNCNYWCVNNVPFAVLYYVSCNDVTDVLEEMKEKYGTENEIIKKINLCNNSTKNELCKYAAENGYLDCLKYANENGCQWNKYTCRNAAKNGHIECLKYAYENSYPWDKKTCKHAALNGYLNCLKYAHENGCPWDEDTCKYAEKNGQLECLKYEHEKSLQK